MKSGTELFKIVSVLGFIPLVFSLTFFFGPWPSGWKEQKRELDSASVFNLKSYLASQQSYYRSHGSYDPTLHNRLPEYVNTFGAIGFAGQSKEVAAICPDCIFKDDQFKLAAIGYFRGRTSIWTIDSGSKLTHVKSF